MRELAEVSRPETLPISGSAFSAETAAVVRARLGGAIPEMIEAVARGVPDYARRARPDYQQRLTDAVTGAVAHFIAHVARPDEPARAITAEFRAIGGTAAREGRTLDALQDALRLGARVAWRWLCEADAGLDRRELSRRRSGTGCGRSTSCSATSCAIRTAGSSCSWRCGSVPRTAAASPSASRPPDEGRSSLGSATAVADRG
jgi:hypothetical protein